MKKKSMKLAAVALTVVLAPLGLGACASFSNANVGATGATDGNATDLPADAATDTTPNSGTTPDYGGFDAPSSDHPQIEIVVKDFGTMQLTLDATAAPTTVANFMQLVNKGYYDGIIFHRVIKDFMIQGGDPNGNGTGGSGVNIKGEFASNGFDNPISHVPGVISMARRGGDNNSASSQFFIVTGDAKFLDGDYAAFGKVTSGYEVAETISKVKTVNDKPETDVVIESIREVK